MGTYSCLVGWRLLEIVLAFRVCPTKGWGETFASLDDVLGSSVEILVCARVGLGRGCFIKVIVALFGRLAGSLVENLA